MKAYFEQEQPAVRVVEQGKIYLFIAINGEWVNRQVENGAEPESYWECDYAEIVADKGQIDVEAVKANPAAYLDWAPPVEKSQKEEIADLKEQNRMLTECLMEMSEIVYA